MPDAQETIDRLARIGDDPQAYAEEWRQRRDGKVIATFPMNFPTELIHAAGALPQIVQEDRAQITAGRNMLYEFYCAYTRSITDQAATEKLDYVDAFFFVDHCIALIGATDAMRYALPDKPIVLAQFIASMDEPWSEPVVRRKIESLVAQTREFTGAPMTDEDLSNSISAFNRNRQLLRHVYDLRRTGRAQLTSRQMQALVKSSMVMDIDEHNEVLTELVPQLEEEASTVPGRIRLHLSGHFCHAPKPELLDLIEECGAVVVDDDLYTGFRHISTDVPEAGGPVDGLARWYMERNVTVPCATRVQNDVDWDDYLLKSLGESGAAGVIVLLAKFCEPHMLYYPELRKALDANGVPHLLIETEHEGLPVEALRTRVETFLERIRRGATPSLATA
jgi:bcr-type benzoyl-CoA reductase subunit C